MMEELPDSVLRQTLTIAADAIICADGDQRITFFNDGAVRIFGYAADEVMGKPLEMLLPDRFRAAHGRHLREFGGDRVVARQMGERRQISGVRRDGTEFPAEAAIAHVATPAGTAFSVVLRDVTERRRIEAVNAQLVRDLQGAVAARDEMLAVVSHDLRNPVNAVKMLSAAVMRAAADIEPAAEIREHAATMSKAAEQMDALIQDLLDVSHIESGKMRLTVQAAPLPSLVQYALSTLAPVATSEGVELRSDIGDDLPPVDVDANRIVQVLVNLASNAVKYTRRGGSVTLTAIRDFDSVRVCVADTGIGISGEDLERVFDRFWQARRTNRSGAGLGLTITRGIVRGHGGRIWMESKEGQGTRVYFTLPVATGPVTHLPRIETRARRTGKEDV